MSLTTCNNSLSKAAVIGLLTTLLFACEPGGSGSGNAVIEVTVTHHQAFIKSGSVHLKYNADADSFPGFQTTVYEQTVPYASKTGQAVIRGLQTGDYWLFVTAYDSLIREPVVGADFVRVENSFGIVRSQIEVFESSHIDSTAFP